MNNYNTKLQTNNTDLQEILDAVNALPDAGSSGNTEDEDAIIDGTLTEYTNDSATNVRGYAFYSFYYLTSVNFPVCTNIGSSAFYNCTKLTSVNFPACIRIGSNAFGFCTSLISINFPVCTSICSAAFHYCFGLTSVNFPVCPSIGSSAFACCFGLTSVDFPVCTNIGSSAFYSCSNLTSVNFPVCTSIGSCAFYNCTNLTSVNFPKVTNIGNYAFRQCYTLSSLTLGASTVCALSNSNAFSSTPYAGYSTSFSGTPYIYVPASLLTVYQTATNWTYFSKYFSAIEGSENGDSNEEGGSSDSNILITFTIDGITYQAKEGMTWSEWCNSEYNTGGRYGAPISNRFDGIGYGGDALISGVQPNDIIIANFDYSIEYD